MGRSTTLRTAIIKEYSDEYGTLRCQAAILFAAGWNGRYKPKLRQRYVAIFESLARKEAATFFQLDRASAR